jgi:hypothetical protein
MESSGRVCKRGCAEFREEAFSERIGERMKEKTKLEAALDELLAGKSTEEIVGPEGLLKQLTKAVLERAMGAEMTHHLGYEKGEGVGARQRQSPERAKPEKGTRRLWCHRGSDAAGSEREF